MSRTASPEKRAEWQRRMERFGRSPLTVADFCRRESVTIAAFYYWRQQLGQSPGSPSAASTKRVTPSRNHSTTERFVPVQVTATSRTLADSESRSAVASSRGSSVIEVMFPNGARLHVPAEDVATLQRSLAAIATVKLMAAGDG